MDIIKKFGDMVGEESIRDPEKARKLLLTGYRLQEKRLQLSCETRTIILYEAPHRLVRTLGELREALGNRRMTLCRELTKKHETAFRTTIDDLMDFYKDEKPLGECVLVIEGRSRSEMEAEKRASWEEISIAEHVAMYEQQGNSRKDAMKLAAKDRGVSKRDIYKALLDGEGSAE